MSSWITAEPNPPGASTLRTVRLFALIGTWMEADVVEATIRNAFTQGCDRVYLVDNGSSDGTVDVARESGAILARVFVSERYDEALRLQHMNAVVSEVSAAEPDAHIWWLYLDADEFPHGPSGVTLRDYVRTLDERFRVVGMRFFDHYPSAGPTYARGFHPLDFQPLCEELAFPMCPARHRKHSLLRYDRTAPAIVCGKGFHVVYCEQQLIEPSQPAFLHHFPFRERAATQRRLDLLWAHGCGEVSRAADTHDTHMLARYRSLDAVYAQDWASVHNFLAIDPMAASMPSPPRARGVSLSHWTDLVEVANQSVARWYSAADGWPCHELETFPYGDDTTYAKGVAFLDGHGLIADWGCGFAHARSFVRNSPYCGVDASSPHADTVADLVNYRSGADCILVRHVLEHNYEWRRILSNAVGSFRKRMALIIFTPFADSTRQIATTLGVTSVPVPDLSFRREDLIAFFEDCRYTEESLRTDTQYGTEHLFYLEK